jgi:hypothetical protein
MSFSFSSLIRLLVLMAVGSTIMAVGLARLTPPRPSNRAGHSAKYTNINEFFLADVTERTPVWLDAETGKMTTFSLEDGDVLETATCSPWSDEKNQRQVVGRWTTRIKDGPMSVSKDFGLARYSFPGGQMLDHVSTEMVPVDSPCWYPGTRARVLFSGGDGLLYHYAFEPEPWLKTAKPEAGRDLKPIQLEWHCPKPGNGKVFFGDITWPDDPRMNAYPVVSLREQIPGPHGTAIYSRTSLWWLKLNLAGTEILDLGRLLVSDDLSQSDLKFDHRKPSIGELADGHLVMSYLRQRMGDSGWELRIAPIEFDSDHHVPRAIESQSVSLATRCQPAQPTFTADGRFLNAIAGPEAKDSKVIRLPLDRVFSRSK